MEFIFYRFLDVLIITPFIIWLFLAYADKPLFMKRIGAKLISRKYTSDITEKELMLLDVVDELSEPANHSPAKVFIKKSKRMYLFAFPENGMLRKSGHIHVVLISDTLLNSLQDRRELKDIVHGSLSQIWKTNKSPIGISTYSERKLNKLLNRKDDKNF